MADIDVEDGNYKDFVFGIGGADVQQYQIQLAHTTNIPFEYEIYRAKSVSETENQKLSFMFLMKRIKRFITK